MIGLNSFLELVYKKHKETLQEEESRPAPAILFGVALTLATIGGVLLVKTISKPQELPRVECLAGETQMVVRFTAGSLVKIAGEPAFQQVNVPLNSFVELNEGYPKMHAALVQSVEEGAILARPLDLISMEYPLLVIDAQDMPVTLGLASVCSIQPDSKELARRGWWQVISTIR